MRSSLVIKDVSRQHTSLFAVPSFADGRALFLLAEKSSKSVNNCKLYELKIKYTTPLLPRDLAQLRNAHCKRRVFSV